MLLEIFIGLVNNFRKIRKGNKCIISANAVVIHDVLSNCSVAGISVHIMHESIIIDEKCHLNEIGDR